MCSWSLWKGKPSTGLNASRNTVSRRCHTQAPRLYSRPPPVTGDIGLVVGVEDRRYRLVGLAGGEVAIYDDLGQKVRLKRNGIHAHSPLNILLRTDGVLRLEGDGVEIHGRTYVQTDVHGKGSRETWTGGTNYDTDSYATGATGAATEHGIDQPSIPSDHPEGA